jgi:hypothetical protein
MRDEPLFPPVHVVPLVQTDDGVAPPSVPGAPVDASGEPPELLPEGPLLEPLLELAPPPLLLPELPAPPELADGEALPPSSLAAVGDPAPGGGRLVAKPVGYPSPQAAASAATTIDPIRTPRMLVRYREVRRARHAPSIFS